jgi:hypothetical protein
MFETKVIVAPNSPSDRIHRQPDRPHQQRKPHYRAGQGGTGPAEGDDDAEPFLEQPAERPAPTEQQQQEIAGDDGRHHQRQVNDHIEQRAAPEAAAGEQQRHHDAERQAAEHCPEADPQRQPDSGHLLRRKGEEFGHRCWSSTAKPYFSNCFAAAVSLR